MSIIAPVLPALINVCKLVSIDLKGPAFISRTIRSSFSGCNVPCCLPVKTVIEFLKAPSPLKDIEQQEFFVQSWTPNSDWLKCPQRVSACRVSPARTFSHDNSRLWFVSRLPRRERNPPFRKCVNSSGNPAHCDVTKETDIFMQKVQQELLC